MLNWIRSLLSGKTKAIPMNIAVKNEVKRALYGDTRDYLDQMPKDKVIVFIVPPKGYYES